MPWITAGATIGAAGIGALGQGFSGGGDGGGADRLADRQADQQVQETATYKATNQPNAILASFMARDRMLQQMGPGGEIGRLINMVDFTTNQVVPYLSSSYQNRIEKTGYNPIEKGIQGAMNKWGPIMNSIGNRRKKKNPMAYLLGGR